MSSSTPSSDSSGPTCMETKEQKMKRIEKWKRQEYIRFEKGSPYEKHPYDFHISFVQNCVCFPMDLEYAVQKELVKNLIIGLMEACRLFDSPNLVVGQNKIIGMLFYSDDYHGYGVLPGWTNNMFNISEKISEMLPSLAAESTPNIDHLRQGYVPVLLKVESEPEQSRFRRAIHLMTRGESSAFFELDACRIRILDDVDATKVIAMPQEFMEIPPSFAEMRLENRLYFRELYIEKQFHRFHLLKNINIVGFDKLDRGDGKSSQGRAIVAEAEEAVPGDNENKWPNFM